MKLRALKAGVNASDGGTSYAATKFTGRVFSGPRTQSVQAFLNDAEYLKKDRAMRVQFVPERVKLSLQNPENLILVENSEDGVVIRAARNNFNERERTSFIRYLAAEGFISDKFERFGKSGKLGASITWIVEGNRPRPTPDYLQRVDRFLIQLVVSASIFWLVLVAMDFLRSA